MFKLALFFCIISLPLNAVAVTISAGFPFNPSSVTVTAGDTVSFQFFGGPHNAAETNTVVPGPSTWNGTGFRGTVGVDFDWTAAGIGNHYYFCEVHGGNVGQMWGHIHVLSPPTATSTITPTETPTVTASHTITPTFSISETFTLGPSPTFSSTNTITPTHSVTPTVCPTPSVSPSQSATATHSPEFARSPLKHVILGPVPAKAGNPLCLAFPAAPIRTLCELYNSRGELVAREKFDSQLRQCISTQNLAPGLYFANIEEEDINQKHKARRQKIVILP